MKGRVWRLRKARDRFARDVVYYGYPGYDLHRGILGILLGGRSRNVDCGGGPPGIARGEGLGVDTSPLPWPRWLACKSQGKARVL